MKTKKISVIVSSAVLLLALLFPPTAKGQWDSGYGDPWGDGKGAGTETSADGETSGPSATWSDFDNGNPLPTGSGLLVLALSGVCYAGAKRLKKQKVEKVETHRSASEKCKDLKIKKMKKVLFIMAAALLTMTQCRKSSDELTPSEAVTVRMTVTTGPGGRTDITPAGGITWSEADELYVGDGEKCVGVLTLLSGGGSATATFSGDVTVTEGGHTFHFYYLGSATNVDVNATEATVDFSSQDIYADDGKLNDAGKYHVGYGKVDNVDVKADTPITGIQVGMKSKVAIAYFRFESGTETPYTGALTLSGDHIYNEMTVKFNADDFSFTTGTSGNISLAGGHEERYVMLVPSGTTSEEVLNFGGGATGTTTFENGIEANKFYRMPSDNSAIVVTVTPKLTSIGTFTVSSGVTVSFAPGNLQYLGNSDGTGTWRFAEHQWDYMGDGPNTTTGKKGNVDLSSLGYLAGMYNTGSGNDGGSETDEDKEAARDLFGWGATGYQDTRAHTYQMNYQPYSTSSSTVNATYNKYGYGPDYDGTNKYGLSVENKSDWGCLAIGEDLAGTWRTLTGAEWGYLLNTRTTETTGLPNASSRYAKVRVNGVSGMLLFPDSFAWDAEKMGTAPTKTNSASAAYTTGSYTVAQFTEQEKSGVVFLPAAGYRSGTSLNYVGSYGYYWSSACGNSYSACNMDFYSSSVIPQYYYDRYYGFSVRLVR